MLTHIVAWKYKDEVSQEKREEHRAKLTNLKNVITEVVDLKVGADALHLARSYDTGLVATFKNLEDLDAYTNHPTHQQVVSFGKEISAHVVSVDFLDKDFISE
jgi:Stress responsive A/B Barrel Domain